MDMVSQPWHIVVGVVCNTTH